jgi:GWxTD domain-containing protein
MKKNFYLGLFLGIFLFLLVMGCAARGPLSPKNLNPKEKQEYKLLKEAGATSEELRSYTLYHLTPTSESKRDSIWEEFWNRRYQALTAEEKAIYYSFLSDSLSRLKYLSFKDEKTRRSFIGKLKDKKRDELLKTEEGKILYFSLELLFSKKEMEEFLMTPDSLREEWLKVWWKKKDPDLTTEGNEFKEELDRRIQHVLTFYHSVIGQKPWDDRGDVYILYGEPDAMEQADYFSDPSGNFTLLDRATSSRDTELKDKESRSQVWFYHQFGEFQFQDNKYIGYWELATYRRKTSEKNRPFDNPNEQVDIAQTSIGEVTNPSELTKQLSQSIQSPTLNLQDRDFEPLRSQSKDLKKLNQLLKTKTEKIEMAKAQVEIDFGGKPLDFPWDWWRFWNEGDTYELEVNLGVPLEKLEILSDSHNPEMAWLFLKERVAIFDAKSMTAVAQDSAIIRKKLPKNLNRKDLLLVDQADFDSLLPANYIISVSVIDSVSQKIGIYNDSVVLVPHVYATAQEKISRLVMSDSIWVADSAYIAENGGKFVRNSLVIIPRPGNVYLEGQLANYYCELYDLKKDENDSLHALVIYNLLYKTEKDEFAFYAAPDSLHANWPAEAQPFLKGTLNLPKGEYIFHIIVHDLNDPKAKKEEVRETASKFIID